MLLPDNNVNPQDSLYYIGSLVIEILKNTPSIKIIDLLQKLNETKSLTIETLLLTLDWLYLVNIVEVNEGGDVTLCI